MSSWAGRQATLRSDARCVLWHGLRRCELPVRSDPKGVLIAQDQTDAQYYQTRPARVRGDLTTGESTRSTRPRISTTSSRGMTWSFTVSLMAIRSRM